MKVVISPDVCVNLESGFRSTSQKAVLSNRQSVCHADVDTVSSVLDIAFEGKNVALVGADTNLLILLLYMWNDSIGSMTMKYEGTKKYSQITRNIGKMVERLT